MKKIFLGIIIGSIILISVLGFSLSSQTDNFAYVDIQKTCGNYFHQEFTEISDKDMAENEILQAVKNNRLFYKLSFDVDETKELIALVYGFPNENKSGSFGINHDNKSYFLRYTFSPDKISSMDLETNCYGEGLIKHYQNQETVQRFYEKYENVGVTISDDSVTFKASEYRTYQVFLHLEFDSNAQILRMNLVCLTNWDENQFRFQGEKQILENLENQHCSELKVNDPENND